MNKLIKLIHLYVYYSIDLFRSHLGSSRHEASLRSTCVHANVCLRRFVACQDGAAGAERLLRTSLDTLDAQVDLRGPGPPGRLSAHSISLLKFILYGDFVWARRPLKH